MRRIPDAARLLGLGTAVLCTAGCTLEEGTGFATMQPATVEATLQPDAARDLGEDRILTDLGYQVTLQHASLQIHEVVLQELRGQQAGGGATTSFDPQNPPEGFSLCHGGHCHADDGALVSYEEVQAQLAGGQVTLAALVSLPVDRAFDLLGNEQARIDRFVPSPLLPRGQISRVRVDIGRLRLSGVVRAGPSAPEPSEAELALEVSLPLDEALSVTANRSLDRDADPDLRLAVAVKLDGTLFDGLDFAKLASDGAVRIEDRDAEGARTLIDSLLRTELHVRLD